MKTFSFYLLMALLGVLLIRLGLWQLDRAEEKRMYAEQVAKASNSLHSLEGLSLKAGQLRYVELSGQYVKPYTLLVANSIKEKSLGFDVISLFKEQQSEALVWVRRGWVAAQNLKDVPQVETPETLAKIKGFVKNLDDNTWIDDLDNPSNDWPFVVYKAQNPKINQRIRDKIGRSPNPYYLHLSEESAHGFAREWSVMGGTSVEKHHAYAFQWFALATVLLVLLIWREIKQRKQNDDK